MLLQLFFCEYFCIKRQVNNNLFCSIFIILIIKLYSCAPVLKNFIIQLNMRIILYKEFESFLLYFNRKFQYFNHSFLRKRFIIIKIYFLSRLYKVY